MCPRDMPEGGPLRHETGPEPGQPPPGQVPKMVWERLDCIRELGVSGWMVLCKGKIALENQMPQQEPSGGVPPLAGNLPTGYDQGGALMTGNRARAGAATPWAGPQDGWGAPCLYERAGRVRMDGSL